MGDGGRDSATRQIGGRFHGGLATLAVITLAGIAIRPAAAAEADASQILYFEPLRIAAPAPPAAASSQQKTSARELQFDAFGRRFALALEPNDKLSPLLQSKSGTASMQFYRGQVNGAAQSWARIAVADGQVRGMFWDGAELYIIEPLANLRDTLPANTSADADATAIFRLADVVMKPGATSCGTNTAMTGSKGSDAYGSLLNELKGAPAVMQAVGATRRLEVSALGDGLFLNRYVTEQQARAEILLRLNNVDGIFSSQLGIEIQVPNIDIGDALSATTAASSLLDELGLLRKNSPDLYSRGLTHLFTGRDLDESTVGIAYVDSLCDRRYGAGLSEASSRSSWIESLIAAHEIGHNFGAVHDGDPDKACASTPTNQFLMSPSVNGSNDQFSSCSLGMMQPNAAGASCITGLSAADVAVAADLGVARRAVGRAFDWDVTVLNSGGLAAVNVRAEILVPPVVIVEDAYVVGGSCTSGAGVILCQLGEIAGGNSNVVHLSLRSDMVGSNSVSVAVSADNELQTNNNSGDGTLSIEAEADLAVSLQAPATATTGVFTLGLSATNLSPIGAESITLSLDLPAGVTATNAILNGTSCNLQIGSITCSLPSVAAGATVTGSASLTTTVGGTVVIQGRISGNYLDPVASNDVAEVTVNVTSPPSSAARSGGSGGGGGSSGALLLSTLLGLLGLKNLQRRHPEAVGG